MKNEEQALFQFGIPLSNRPRWQLFLLCSSGVFFGYLVYGVCEEYVYNRLQFSHEWYFTLVQGLIYVALIYFLNDPTPKNPWKTYSKLSAVLMRSYGLTKGSLFFLGCPAQIMFSCPAQIMLRSTEVYPVIIMWPFIPDVRRKYPLHEFISAILLVVGLILLTLADAQTSPNISVINVLMTSGALIMDYFLWNLPEVVFNFNSNTTQMELLFCSMGFPFLISVIARGALKTAWFSCGQQLYVNGVLVFEAYATSAGQVFVLSLIAVLGAMTTAAMPLTKQHFCGLLLMSMGIIMKRLPENKPLPPQKTSPLRQTEKPSGTEDNRFRIGTEEEEEKTDFLV